MQALLSYDQSPPMAAPFRFFLTAPLFALLAGALLLWEGPDILASRWTPGLLAVTHLITVGFMLQVMLGALVQILPVVAGANLARPLQVSAVVHAMTTIGTLCLVAAFMSFAPLWFALASFFLGTAGVIFVLAAARALLGVPSTSPTITGLKLALSGLVVTVTLGVLMSMVFGGGLDLPILQIADYHAAWGFVAWGLVLLTAVAYVVVPMFQLTPNYPRAFGVGFLRAAVAAVSGWNVIDMFWPGPASTVAAVAVLAFPVSFAVATLRLQGRSKRPRFDATQHLWRGAMVSTLLAGWLWGVAMAFPVVSEWPGWPVLFGVLVLFGGFVSVISGMLYKIVPFLIWLHLQNLGRGRLMAPNMKKIIAEQAMKGQMLAHFSACGLLVFAVIGPAWGIYPAALAVMVSSAWLVFNLRAGMRVYTGHRQKILELTKPESASTLE